MPALAKTEGAPEDYEYLDDGSGLKPSTQGWHCFHCWEYFANPNLAAMHFGADPSAKALCQIKRGHERMLGEEIRRLEAEVKRLTRELEAKKEN